MKITYVAKRKLEDNYERYKIYDLEQKEDNPFFDVADPGDCIRIEDLAGLISSSPIKMQLRDIRHFILNALLDGYTDIRYYYS